MKNACVIPRILRPSVAGALLAVLAMPAGAVDLKTADGSWTFSIDGNVNVDYIYSSCQSPNNAIGIAGGQGLTCVGSQSSNNVSNIGNGLLPAAFSFGVATTQDGIDLAAHLGLYPGIATNDGGSPNLQGGTANGSSNVALGSTGLDIRQVYMTFGNKDMGTFTLGRNIGLFGADVILNDMTLPGVGAPGSAAGPAPSNTTLGGIGFGYIYTDWLAQIDYTTPDFSGFSVTAGIFDPLNSLSDAAIVQPKKAPGFHAKIVYTTPLNEGSKLYLSASLLTQQQDYATGLTIGPPTYSYTGTGEDIFAKLDIQDWELIGYYYHATGLGSTALFDGGAFIDAGVASTRTSSGYLAQTTYKFGPVKVGFNYGRSNLNYADDPADRLANPNLLANNTKYTLGVYYSLTKNLTLLAEGSRTKSTAQNDLPTASGGLSDSNSGTTVNVGAYLGF
jgi:predicted porin